MKNRTFKIIYGSILLIIVLFAINTFLIHEGIYSIKFLHPLFSHSRISSILYRSSFVFWGTYIAVYLIPVFNNSQKYFAAFLGLFAAILIILSWYV